MGRNETLMSKLISFGGKRASGSSVLPMLMRSLLILLVLIVVLVNLLTHVFMVVRYYGNGMEPNLTDRQLLVIQKTDDVEQGDMIAFYFNNKILVRRVICSGGRILTIDAGGSVFVDGVMLEEPYVTVPSIGQHNIDFPYNVPYGHYFVMGDNRVLAMDSRLTEIGTVPAERIIGKVIISF